MTVSIYYFSVICCKPSLRLAFPNGLSVLRWFERAFVKPIKVVYRLNRFSIISTAVNSYHCDVILAELIAFIRQLKGKLHDDLVAPVSISVILQHFACMDKEG